MTIPEQAKRLLLTEHKYRYHSNGQVHMEWTEVNGKIDGILKYYNESSQLVAEVPYKDAIRNGIAKYYNESGQLYEELSFKDDSIDGIVRYYNESGELIKEIE